LGIPRQLGELKAPDGIHFHRDRADLGDLLLIPILKEDLKDLTLAEALTPLMYLNRFLVFADMGTDKEPARVKVFLTLSKYRSSIR